MQQVHNLRDARPVHVLEPGQRGIVLERDPPQEPVEAHGQGHQARQPWRGRLRLGQGLCLLSRPEFLRGAPTVALEVDGALDYQRLAHAQKREALQKGVEPATEGLTDDQQARMATRQKTLSPFTLNMVLF